MVSEVDLLTQSRQLIAESKTLVESSMQAIVSTWRKQFDSAQRLAEEPATLSDAYSRAQS
jgi:hypothetical protein